MGMAISASNQDTNRMGSLKEGVFVVKAVYVDSDGIKWFGTNRGLCRYDDLTWTYYTDEDHLVGNAVNALSFEAMEEEQGLWVATSQGISWVSFDEIGVTGSIGYTTDDGLLENDVSDIAQDSRGGKFFGSEGGITWFHTDTMEHLLYVEYYSNMFNKPIRQMDTYNDTLYIAQDGGIGRLISEVDGISGASRWEKDYGITPFSDNIRSVKVNGIDKQWFGTDVGVEIHKGYSAKKNWELLSTADGLVNDDVISIAEDADGGLWFGTFGGVSHFYNETWTSYTTADGLLNDTVYDIAFEQDGSVWMATGAGACKLKDGTFQDFIVAVPEISAANHQFTALFNPATQSIHLAYQLDKPAPASVRLYNTSGMLVGAWTGLSSQAGENQVELPFTGQARGGPMQGIYVIQLIHGNQSGTKKLVITR